MNGHPPQDQARELAVLRDEIELLREQIYQIREAFCGPLPLLWHIHLTKHESLLLATLYRRNGLVTREAMHIALSGIERETQDKLVDVILSHLRKKICGYGIEIETIRTTGFRLTPDSREIIRGLVRDHPRQLDDDGKLFELRRAG